jgi:hypothetical protein
MAGKGKTSGAASRVSTVKQEPAPSPAPAPAPAPAPSAAQIYSTGVAGATSTRDTALKEAKKEYQTNLKGLKGGQKNPAAAAFLDTYTTKTGLANKTYEESTKKLTEDYGTVSGTTLGISAQQEKAKADAAAKAKADADAAKAKSKKTTEEDVTQVPTQSFQTQTALIDLQAAVDRAKMAQGAVLDQQNKEFFTTQDIRQTQAVGAETRATIGAQTASTLKTQGQLLAGQLAQISESGLQARQTAVTTGEQARLTQGQLLAGQLEQIGATGREQRLTAATTGEQERLTVGATGEQQRLTQAQLLAGQLQQIGETGTQSRLTQEQLLAGQSRQIGETGTQSRLTQEQLLAGQSRQIGETGEQQRLTQEQLLAGQLQQIGETGEQQRATTRTAAEEQRKTDLQQIMQANYIANRNQQWARKAFRA